MHRAQDEVSFCLHGILTLGVFGLPLCRTGAARDDTLSATVQNPASQPATNHTEPPIGRASTKESNGGEVVDVQAIKHHARIHFPTTPEAPQIMTAKPQHRLSTGPGGRDNLLNPESQLPPKAIGV